MPRTARHLLQRVRERGEAAISPDYRAPAAPDDDPEPAQSHCALDPMLEHSGRGGETASEAAL